MITIPTTRQRDLLKRLLTSYEPIGAETLAVEIGLTPRPYQALVITAKKNTTLFAVSLILWFSFITKCYTIL